MSDFRKFVASPYFNLGRSYESLVNILVKFYPEFESEELIKQNIYHKLYPGKKFKESVINTVLSGLNQLCEEFFLYQDFRNNPQRDLRLLRQYCKRGHKPKADKLSAKIEKLISIPTLSGLEIFNRIELFHSLDSYYSNYDKRSLRNQLMMKALMNLDYYFILQSIVYKKELLSNSLYSENNIDDNLPLKILKEINFEKLIGMIEIEEPENSILLSIYFLIEKTLNDNFDDVNYNKLKKLILNNFKKTGIETGKYLILNLQVINTRRLNAGRKEYEKELYEILKLHIDEMYYASDKNWVRASHFRTIIKLGISQRDFKYIEYFIQNYHKRLEPNFRTPLKHYAYANLFFAKKMYSEALNDLIKAEMDNTLFKIDSKRLTAMIYYETNSIENLKSLLDTFSHFLKNIRTIDEIIISRNKNFIKYLKKLIKFRESETDSYEINLLKNTLLKENVSDTNWLQNKLSEINF